jgi:hypothetical protein
MLILILLRVLLEHSYVAKKDRSVADYELFHVLYLHNELDRIANEARPIIFCARNLNS